MAEPESNQIELQQRDYLSPKGFVQETGLSMATVRRYLADGVLPKLQLGGKRARVLIPRSALESFSLSRASTTNIEPRATGVATSSTVLGTRRRGPQPRWLKPNTTKTTKDLNAKDTHP